MKTRRASREASAPGVKRVPACTPGADASRLAPNFLGELLNRPLPRKPSLKMLHPSRLAEYGGVTNGDRLHQFDRAAHDHDPARDFPLPAGRPFFARSSDRVRTDRALCPPPRLFLGSPVGVGGGFAVVGQPDEIYVLDAAQGTYLQTLTPANFVPTPPTGLTGAVAMDGSIALIPTTDKTAILFDIATSNVVRTLVPLRRCRQARRLAAAWRSTMGSRSSARRPAPSVGLAECMRSMLQPASNSPSFNRTTREPRTSSGALLDQQRDRRRRGSARQPARIKRRCGLSVRRRLWR